MHQTSRQRWWLLLTFIISVSFASLPLNVATTYKMTDGVPLPRSYYKTDKEPHALIDTETAVSLMHGGRGFEVAKEKQPPGMGRSLTIFEITLEDETAEEVDTEEDEQTGELGTLKEEQRERVVTESLEGFATISEDVPVSKEETAQTVSGLATAAVKPPLPPTESAPSPEPKDALDESPEPSTTVLESADVKSDTEGPASTPDKEPEIEKSIVFEEKGPAIEPAYHLSSPTPIAAPPEPTEEAKEDTATSPVPEEQLELEEAPSSAIPESDLDIEEHSSSPSIEAETPLDIKEAPPSTIAKEPLDLDESVSGMEPPMESDVEEAVPSIRSEKDLDIEETPIVKLEELIEWEEVPSTFPEQSPDIEEGVPGSAPDIEATPPSAEPTESSDIEEDIQISLPEESPFTEPLPSPTPTEIPDIEEFTLSVASEPSYSEHADEPLEEKVVHDSPAPAPSIFDVKETTVMKPFKTDVSSRRPPWTLEIPRSTGLRRTLLPITLKTVQPQHRHPVAPEPIDCDCQSAPTTKCESSRATEHETTSPLKLVPPSPLPNNRLHYSPIGECSQICAQAGESYQVCPPPGDSQYIIAIQERSITCKNFVGIPVPLTECHLPSDLQTQFYSRCNTHACGPRHYIVLSEWSACPQKCATVFENGTVVSQQRMRDYECRKVEDGSLASRKECNLFVQDLDIALRSDCHSIPCERYGYKTSNWSSCDCHSWKRHRRLKCLHWSTGEEVDVAVCEAYGLLPPNTEHYCYPASCIDQRPTRRLLQTKNDHCHFTQCSSIQRPLNQSDSVCAAKGDCSGGRCLCEDGFEGVDCQMDKRISTECQLPSLLNANGDCCASGVFDLNGQCCQEHDSMAEVDIDGHCCTESLDACGLCHEKPHYLDAAMQCCEVLDASGTCCASGVIDECGVCDGIGRSCDTTIFITIIPDKRTNVDSCGAELRDVVEDALDTKHIAMNVHKEGIPHFAFSKAHVSMTSGFIHFKLERAMARTRLNRLCHVDAINIEKRPVCGNGFCEIGELERCSQDCGYEMKMCPVQWEEGKLSSCHGHGQCVFVNASRCECHTGYEGFDCRDCSPGFFHVGNDSRCIPTEAMINRPTVVASGSHSIDRDHPKDASRDGWRYWPLYVYFILFLVCVIIFLVQRRKRQEEENEIRSIPRAMSILDRAYDPAWTSYKDREPFISHSRTHSRSHSRTFSR